MATINQGILGPINGKVGGVVGGVWRGIPVIRAYAVPANPQTESQTTQRTKFSLTIAFAKSILSSVIQKFWANKYPNMTEFNSFTKVNIPLTDPESGVDVLNKTTIGSLESTIYTGCTYNATTGDLIASWMPACLGNGLPTDWLLMVIYDKVNQIAFVTDGNTTRATGTKTMNVGGGRIPADLLCWLSFYRGTAPNYLTSDSLSSAVSPSA